MFVYKCIDLSVVIFPPLTESATFILIYKKRQKNSCYKFCCFRIWKNDKMKGLFVLSEEGYKGYILNYTSIWFLFS